MMCEHGDRLGDCFACYRLGRRSYDIPDATKPPAPDPFRTRSRGCRWKVWYYCGVLLFREWLADKLMPKV